MDIGDRIMEVIKDDKQNFNNNLNFNKLLEFYTKMKQLGIVQNQQYSLPPLDTIGKWF